MRVRHVLVLLLGVSASLAAAAQQQIRFAGGASHATNLESTYGWELGYAQGLGEHAFLSFGWLNEGHQENSHRDGFTAELWARTGFFDQRLSLAVGAGPFIFFDTTRDEAHPYYAQYGNEHGLQLIYSAEAAWHLNSRWLLYLRANRIGLGTDSKTSMLLFGVGYEFRGGPSAGSYPAFATAPARDFSVDNALTLYLGRSVLNSFAPERSTAFAVEYRRRLNRYSDWTVGWLNEGGNQLIRRNGITTQYWLMRPLLHERIELGLGLGAYIVVNQQDHNYVVVNGQVTEVGSDDERVAGIVSLSADYNFNPRWFVRTSFNRLVTRYDRDADVILLGAGFRF